MNPWVQDIWYANVVLTAAVLLNLCRIGVAGRYQLLFLYLAADFVQSILLFTVSYTSSRYANIYLPTQIAKIGFSALLLIQIYSFILRDRPALARFGRATVGYVLLAALLIAGIGLLWDAPPTAGKQVLLTRSFILERTLTTTMVVFEAIVAVFLSWFPVKLLWNELLLIIGFLVLHLSRALLAQLANMFQGRRASFDAVNIGYLAISSGCLLVWLFGLRRDGETRTANTGPRRSPERARELTLQLDAINAFVGRAAAKRV